MQGTDVEDRPVSTDARPRRLRRTLVVLAGLLILLLLVAGAGVIALTSIGDGVDRIPGAFAPLETAERPVATEATTFLVVGTDTRTAEATDGTEIPAQAGFGPGRADAIMLATVQPDGTTGSVISIPRDSWVDVPGRGMNKVNAAYAFGGPSLLILTVEALTGVRVDHFGVVDFAGFRSLVDAVGGIDVQVAAATSDLGVQFRAGSNHLDGLQAVAYVHQRYGLPGGDIDRGKRQQNAIRGLLNSLQEKAGSDPESPLLPLALSAWELPGQDGVPDRERIYESVWSIDPAAVRGAARVCADVAAAAGAPQADDARHALQAERASIAVDTATVTSLLGRVLAHVDQR